MSWYHSWHNHRFHPHVHWGTFLITCFLATSYLLGAINLSYADINTGLIGHWKFNGNTTDAIGFYNGTSLGGPTYSTGVIGSAILLDGVDDYVSTAYSVSSVGAFTGCAWVKYDDPSGVYHSIFRTGGSAPYYLYVINGGGATDYFNLYNGIISAATPSNSVQSNTWTHVCATIADSVGTVYINGVLRSGPKNLTPRASANGTLFIGASNLGAQPFKGMLDDVRIYNRALSSVEVSELYNYTDASGIYPTPSSSSTGDTTAPVISSISSSNITQTGATISWTTNENVNAKVQYGLTSSYGSTSNSSGTTNHSVNLTGLTPGTLYHYRISATDSSNNNRLSSDQSFTTSATVYPTPAYTTPVSNSSELIPASRRVNWKAGDTVGVPGGIPTNRTKCVTTACQALENIASNYKDGSTNATPIIQAAINSAQQNTFVLIPPGTYLITTAVSVGATKDYVTLRGSGIDTTTFDCRVDTCVLGGSQSDWNWPYPSTGNTITTGLTKNSTQISIPSTSSFSVGQIARIKVADDYSIPVISVGGFNNSRGQVVRITGKTSSTLSFYPPLYDDYTGQAASVNVARNQSDFIGIEDMTLIGTNGTIKFGIWFSQTYGSWIKNVKVIHSSNYNVFIDTSLNCEIRHSILDELKKRSATPNGAGLLFNKNSGCLIEDNIIRESFPNIEVNGGSSGNVFAYNYIKNNNGVIGIDTNHAPHNQFNLYEGNVAHNLMADGYFGSVSDDTLFRNWFTGGKPGYCLSLKRMTRDYNLVGNLFGNLEYPSSPCVGFGKPNIGNDTSSGTAQPSVGDGWVDFNLTLGTPNIRGTLTTRTDDKHGIITLSSGNLRNGQAPNLSLNGTILTTVIISNVSGNTVQIDSSPWGTSLPPLNTDLVIWPGPGGFQELDLDVEATTLKRGNWYAVSNSIPAAEALGNLALPNSLHYSSKPAWFGNFAWPPISPNSPNITLEVIPAGYRFAHGVDAAIPSYATPPPTTVEDPYNQETGVNEPANATIPTTGGEIGVNTLTEEAKQALIIQIMLKIIDLLTQLIAKLKSGAAAAVTAISSWGLK